MRRGKQLGFCEIMAVIVFLVAAGRPAVGQGLQSTLRARAHVFPAVGPGVAAIKRDSAGRYYILAKPANTIFIYDATGKLVGQIPNANSGSATIRYAVDIDVDSRDRLFVVDRGANAIKIFSPDGSLATAISVNAPTSVVALSDGQFAVTSLLSKRLVQIMDETGKTIRTFGDPAEVAADQSGAQTQTQPSLADRGRIIGDAAGNIYFAFTSLPDPTLQRFDRFGYSAYESVVPQDTFGAQGRNNSRVELGYTMSALGWPSSLSAWTDLHSLTSVSMSGHGQRGRRGQAATDSTSSSGSSAAPFGNVTSQGNVLAYTADTDSGDLDFDSSVPSDAEVAAILTGPEMPGLFGMGIGGSFHGGLFHDRPAGSFGEAGAGPASGFAGKPGGETGGAGEGFGPGGHGFEGFHYHPGFDTYRATGTVRVYLDNPPQGAREKPVISAVGVDPSSKDVWAAIGDMLVHFDSGGARLEMYYLLLTDGGTLKPTSILVEPDRLLIGADPWGIYEFPRPDRPSGAPAAQRAIVPQQVFPALPASTPVSPQR
jgi:hypothetical protein